MVGMLVLRMDFEKVVMMGKMLALKLETKAVTMAGLWVSTVWRRAD